MAAMTTTTPPQIAQMASALLGVPISAKRIRAWVRAGHLPARTLPSGRLVMTWDEVKPLLLTPFVTS